MERCGSRGGQWQSRKQQCPWIRRALRPLQARRHIRVHGHQAPGMDGCHIRGIEKSLGCYVILFDCSQLIERSSREPAGIIRGTIQCSLASHGHFDQRLTLFFLPQISGIEEGLRRNLCECRGRLFAALSVPENRLGRQVCFHPNS
jgi:hypothetical protein